MVDKTTDATFDQDVLKASGPVVVDFWAEWCGPCRMIAPALEEISKSLNGKVKIVKLNVDENPNTAAKFGIMSNLAAVLGFSSTLSLTILTLPLSDLEISSSAGAIMRQGPHHSAQKSTTTGPEAFSTS